mgnify:CR=1 FL=1
MKQFLYLIICIVLLGFGGLFVLKQPNGSPWLSVNDFYNFQSVNQKITDFKKGVADQTQSLLNSDLLNSDLLSVVSIDENAHTIYKWQDQQGTWHYSDNKPDSNTELNNAINITKVWIKPENLTVIPALKPVSNNRSDPANNNVQSKNYKSNLQLNHPHKLKTVVQDTLNVQAIMDNRTNRLDSQLKQM